MIRVLHLTAGNLFGGIETYLVTLARCRHLAPEMEPQFGLCYAGRLRDELVREGVPTYALGNVRLSRPWTTWSARRKLRECLQNSRFDAVVTHGSWPHAVFAPVVRRTGVLLVTAVHGDLNQPGWLDRQAARTPPDLVIANSSFTAAAAAKLFFQARIAVVAPGVLAPVATSADRDRLRADFNVPSGAVVILMVSRIEELKGHKVLINALGQIEHLPNWLCWFVGGAQRPIEVKLLSELKRLAAKLGNRVQWLGPRSDVSAVMSAADIYCQPNTGPEGFGLTLVEALQIGLPVITSGFGGAAEIVDGSCGVLTSPGDTSAVAAAIEELVRNPARRTDLGSKGPSRVRDLCDPKSTMRRLAVALRS